MTTDYETGGVVAGAVVLSGMVLKVWDRLARRSRRKAAVEKELREELWKEINALRDEMREMRQDHAIEISTLRAQHAQELNYWRELATTNRARS